MNNDLLKRIDESFFFVVDADGQQRLDKLLNDCRAEIEAIRQVLADTPSVDALIGVDDWIEAKPILFPTTESLIAEAVAKEREACAKLCDAIAGNPKDFFEQFRRGAGRCAADIRARGVK